MPVDLAAAQRFMFANARLLDRHRLTALLRGHSAELVLATLRAYRNADGGFGHALEPDVRGPDSEPTSTLHALDVLAEIGALNDPMVAEAFTWVSTIADPDGGIPFVMPTTAVHPHAPWMVPVEGGSHVTFGFAGVFEAAGLRSPWLDRASRWCWEALARPDYLQGYLVKFALEFLDHVTDDDRAGAAIERLRSLIGADGGVPVPGGEENERLTALTLSPRPTGRSRRLFTEDQIRADLDRLERGQQDDGGWNFDWLAWSPGQSVEWRGAVTLRALSVLSAHGRIEAADGGDVQLT